MITALRRAERERGLSGVPLSINQDEGIHNLPAGRAQILKRYLDEQRGMRGTAAKDYADAFRHGTRGCASSFEGVWVFGIARTMQTTEKAVDNALQRARGKLKRFFSK